MERQEMKIEFKLILFSKEQIRILPARIIIAYDKKVIFFSGDNVDSNISYQNAKTYKRRLKLKGFRIR